MNNMKYQISLWHGPNAALEQKLTSVGCVKIKYDWFYEGTLDAFASDYKDKFMYIHNTPQPKQPTKRVKPSVILTHSMFSGYVSR